MIKVLVADDERWIRRGILKMIDQEGLGIEEIQEADSVESAMQVFLAMRPQLVISDVRFPVEDGCLLCKRIYEIAPETKFVMLSGYDDFEYVKSALGYKAIDYLLKPVDKTVLNETIARGIREYQKENGSMREQNEGMEPELFPKTAKSGQKGEDLIRIAMEGMKVKYRDKITLTNLAAAAHMNEAYYSNLFKKIAGVPPMTYLMELRVEKAKDLMLVTKERITDIAWMVGYEDSHYFAKVFKKVTGETPKEYKLRQELENETEDEKV